MNLIPKWREQSTYSVLAMFLSNIYSLFRLLAQLDETETAFDDFWSKHQQKLEQCLQLRHFELHYKEVIFLKKYMYDPLVLLTLAHTLFVVFLALLPFSSSIQFCLMYCCEIFLSVMEWIWRLLSASRRESNFCWLIPLTSRGGGDTESPLSPWSSNLETSVSCSGNRGMPLQAKCHW